MRSIITYFIKYPITGNLLILAIMGFGYLGLKNLKSTFFPVYEPDTIMVQAIYPGASPEEVEEGIVTRIEQRLKGQSGIYKVSSKAMENAATVTIEIERGRKVDVMVQDVKNSLDRISSFPVGMEKLVVYKLEGMTTAISFSLNAEMPLPALKQMARKVEDDLLAQPGISKIELAGFPEEEVAILLNEEVMQGYGISFDEVAKAVGAWNLDVTGGTVKTEAEDMLIRARHRGHNAKDMRAIVVRSRVGGGVVRLSDIAQVEDRWSEQPNRRYLDRKPSVVVIVSSLDDEDLLPTAEYVRGYIEKFNKENSQVKADLIYDGSTTLQQRIDLLVSNGVFGFFLVFIVLALFLRIRLAFWVASSIPVSFMGMFLLASFFGITINVMSLFGMILVVGILVDDGIVIGENIYQQFERGKGPLQAAIDGSIEVLPSVVSSVLTTVVMFCTFFFLDGRLGKMVPDLAFVVIATLMISLVEAAFILPAHIAHSRDLMVHGEKGWFDRFSDAVSDKMSGLMNGFRDRVYAPAFDFLMANRLLGLSFFIAAFMASVAALKGGHVKTTFFPFIERDEVTVNLDLPVGTNERITKDWLDKIETVAWQVNDSIRDTRTDTANVVMKVEQAIGPGPHQGRVSMYLLDGEARNMKVLDITQAIRKRVGTIPDAENLSYGVRTPFGKPVSVSLFGNDLHQLEMAKTELKAQMSGLKDIADIITSDQKGYKEIDIELNDKAKQLGLTLADVMRQVRQGFFGHEVQRLQRGEDEVKVWVRYADEGRTSLDDLGKMRIRTADGGSYPLSELTTYSVDRGLLSINRLYGKREVRIEGDIAHAGVSATDVMAQIEDEFLPPILARYPNVTYGFEGQAAESRKVGVSAGKALPVMFLLMLAIIIITFRSFSQAFMVVLMIPFGLMGVVLGHWMHAAVISLFSFFGIIALIGVMVNDSIVLIETLNMYLQEGKRFAEALREAAISRFRPIMLTSVTTIAGLGPLILEKSFQAQFLVPMAIAVAYGLAAATFITLVLLPVTLSLANDMRQYALWLWEGERPTPEEVEPAVKELKHMTDV